MRSDYSEVDVKDNQTGGHILVVEDDAALSDIVCSYLRLMGYEVVAAYSGTEACLFVEKSSLELGGSWDLDAIVCDLILPGMPGEDFIRRMNAVYDVPIIVTSAKDAVADKVDVLRMGAIDYLVKPFELEELLARLEAQMRRSKLGRIGLPSHDHEEVPLKVGGWQIYRLRRSFSANGRNVRLTNTEFDIITLLAEHPGRVYSRYELLDATHDRGDGRMYDESTINSHIANIRAKLRDSGTDHYIETVWGIGFKLGDDLA